MPIKFHFQKIAKRSLIRSFKILDNHILKNLLNDDLPKFKLYNSHNIGSLTNCQKSLTKGHLIDSSIKSYGIFSSFSPLDPEFSPGHWCQDHWWWTLFYFLFSLYFTFLFLLLFTFLFLEQLGLGFISHAVTSVTNWWRSHKTDHRAWKNKVKGSGTKWHHTAWTTHAGLMLYSWSFRVGCTVASTDHG